MTQTCTAFGCRRPGVPVTEEELREAGFLMGSDFRQRPIGVIRCGIHNPAKMKVRTDKARATREANQRALAQAAAETRARKREAFTEQVKRLTNDELVDALQQRDHREPNYLRDALQEQVYRKEAYNRLRQAPTRECWICGGEPLNLCGPCARKPESLGGGA